MLFSKSVTVSGSTTPASPQRELLEVGRGFLLKFYAYQTSGTDGTSAVRVLANGTAVLPRNRSEMLTITKTPQALDDLLPLLTPPYDLNLEFSNSDGGSDVVTIAALVVEPDLLWALNGLK